MKQINQYINEYIVKKKLDKPINSEDHYDYFPETKQELIKNIEECLNFNNYNLTHIIIVLEMYLESYAINNTHKRWYNFFLPKKYVIHCENYLMYFFFLHFEEIVGDYYIVTPISDKEHILQYEEIPIWTRIMRHIFPLNNKHTLLK